MRVVARNRRHCQLSYLLTVEKKMKPREMGRRAPLGQIIPISKRKGPTVLFRGCEQDFRERSLSSQSGF